jgi:hypothetical protein
MKKNKDQEKFEVDEFQNALQKGWSVFLTKDRVQSFFIIMTLFTILYLAGQIPLEFYQKVSTWSIAGVFGAEAADNITNLRRM